MLPLRYFDIQNTKKHCDFLCLSIFTHLFSVISNGITSTASMFQSWDWPALDASCTGKKKTWLREVSEHSSGRKTTIQDPRLYFVQYNKIIYWYHWYQIRTYAKPISNIWISFKTSLSINLYDILYISKLPAVCFHFTFIPAVSAVVSASRSRGDKASVPMMPQRIPMGALASTTVCTQNPVNLGDFHYQPQRVNAGMSEPSTVS